MTSGEPSDRPRSSWPGGTGFIHRVQAVAMLMHVHDSAIDEESNQYLLLHICD